MEEKNYSEEFSQNSEITETNDTNNETNSDAEQRREYEDLISGKYKKFYTEDTQKMINKRFRKYKELEEHAKRLEDEKAQFEQRLKDEVERSAREATDRLISSIRAKHQRPDENGTYNSKNQSKRDISTLSRSERADMARRASKGEKITI